MDKSCMKRYGALSALAELGLSDFVRSVWQGRVGGALLRELSVAAVCQSGQLEQPPQPAQLHLSAQALVLDWQ